MRHLAQARNPYSLSWLWIPGSRFARPGMTDISETPLTLAPRRNRRYGSVNLGLIPTNYGGDPYPSTIVNGSNS